MEIIIADGIQTKKLTEGTDFVEKDVLSLAHHPLSYGWGIKAVQPRKFPKGRVKPTRNRIVSLREAPATGQSVAMIYQSSFGDF